MKVDLEALWNQYRPLVFRECRKYYGMNDYEDLLQEGFLALCEAAGAYDLERGSFYICALHYIRKRIYEYRAGACDVYIPRNLQAAILKYRGREPLPSLSEIQRDFNCSERTARTIQRAIPAASGTASLSATVKSNDDDLELEDTISDDTHPEYTPESVLDSVQAEELKEAVRECLYTLSPDEREVIRCIYYDGKTAADTARERGDRYDKVKRTEEAALSKLRKPANRYRLEAFREDVIRNNGMRHTGFTRFNQTWTSATEREALRLLEMGDRYR